ncbi:MAG: hypothetical protein LBH21_01305 [Gracilibacteraceae bacterium]|jgi:hypothetical protein|nr:hypothetical protein [Gracilibacteraceae bacterium]
MKKQAKTVIETLDALGLHIVLCASLCALLLSACSGAELADEEPGDEEPIAGLITSEIGSSHDYIGWWQLDDYDEDSPFVYIEIPEEDSRDVNCYDANFDLIDTGFINYSEQRALNGNDLMVFIFSNIGEYGASPYDTPDASHMNIRDNSQFIGVLTACGDDLPPAARSLGGADSPSE